MICPKCGSEMIRRNGKKGPFWGCSSYPACNGIVDIKESGSVSPPKSSKHDVVIQRVEKPHSYEFGSAGDIHKIYYNDVSELQDHIKSLENAGLVSFETKQI